MRLSRDKVNKLAHVVTDAVADLDEVEFIEDRNTIRLEVRKILEELLMQEARIDQAEATFQRECLLATTDYRLATVLSQAVAGD